MMRRLMTLSGLVLALSFSAQGKKPVTVPYRVSENFSLIFPGALYMQWETLKEHSLYAARFVYENQSYVAYFEEEGPFVASIVITNTANLPSRIRAAISSLYRDAEILKVEEFRMQGDLSYFFEIKKDDRLILLKVTSKGKMLSVQEKTKRYMQRKKFLE